MQKKGFSTLEIFISISLIILGITAAVLVSGGSETMLSDVENYDEGLTIAEEAVISAEVSLFDNFLSVYTSNENLGIFTKSVSESYRDSFSKKITSNVSWDNGRGGKSFLEISEVVSDPFGLEKGELCEGMVGDWRYPKIVSTLALPNLTDVYVSGKYAYLTADSSALSEPDFYVIDLSDPSNPVKLSEINTGPGLVALVVSEDFAYVANTSVNSQLQVIDISDPSNPNIVKVYKVPGVDTSSGGLGRSIFYERKKIYLGVTKNLGPEFNIINVNDPLSPSLIGSFETDTLVNRTKLLGNIALVATPNSKQLRVLDLTNPTDISEIFYIDLPGSAFHDGKSVLFYDSKVYLGRTVGAYKEFYIFHLDKDYSLRELGFEELGGSANDFVLKTSLIFIATNSSSKELQVLDVTRPEDIFLHGFLDLPAKALALSCDQNFIYVVTDGSVGFFVIKDN